MNIQIYINKKSISINDRAFNYGDGLFETILVENYKPKYFSDHIKRLHHGCDKLNLAKPNRKLLSKYTRQAIGRTKKCIIKIIYSRGETTHGYTYTKKLIPHLYIIKKKLPERDKTINLTLGLSKHKIIENDKLAEIKHLNRLDQVLASSDNIQSKYDELILTSKSNHIVECISSNIFFYNYNENRGLNIETPDLGMHGVEGILRNKVIQTFRQKKIKITIKNISLNEHKKYTGCFITNSIQGVRFVSKFNKKRYSHIPLIESLLDNYIYEE